MRLTAGLRGRGEAALLESTAAMPMLLLNRTGSALYGGDRIASETLLT